MSVTPALVIAATVLGFAVLLLTVGAFVIGRERLGAALLVVSAAVFVGCLALMGLLSSHEQAEARQAVLHKYRATVQQWGAPLGPSPQWEVDGRLMTDCAVNLDDPHDPVVSCNGKELPIRHR